MLAPCIFYCVLQDYRERPNHRSGNRAPLTGILPFRLLSPHPVPKIVQPSHVFVGARLDPLCSRHVFSIVFCGILANGRNTEVEIAHPSQEFCLSGYFGPRRWALASQFVKRSLASRRWPPGATRDGIKNATRDREVGVRPFHDHGPVEDDAGDHQKLS